MIHFRLCHDCTDYQDTKFLVMKMDCDVVSMFQDRNNMHKRTQGGALHNGTHYQVMVKSTSGSYHQQPNNAVIRDANVWETFREDLMVILQIAVSETETELGWKWRNIIVRNNWVTSLLSDLCRSFTLGHHLALFLRRKRELYNSDVTCELWRVQCEPLRHGGKERRTLLCEPWSVSRILMQLIWCL